ncbi:MAG: hypothetical protein N4A35_07810 [Flavobacteriales bacterium]|jgi:hypothetical protein|nr:hypothetical protein [Flavobacteriales bacterium]
MKAIYSSIPVFVLLFTSCASSLNLAYEDDLYADEENIYIAQMNEESTEGADDYYDPNYSDVYKSDYFSEEENERFSDDDRYFGSPNAGFYNNSFNPYFGYGFNNSFYSNNAWGNPYNYNSFGYNPYCISCGGFGYNPYFGNSYNAWGTPYNNFGYGYYTNNFGYNPYYGTYNPYYGGYYGGNNNSFANNDMVKPTGGHRGRGVSTGSRHGSSYRFSNGLSNHGNTSNTTNSGNEGYTHVVPTGMKVVDNDVISAKEPVKTEYKPTYNHSISSINNAQQSYSSNTSKRISNERPTVSSSSNSAWNNARQPARASSGSSRYQSDSRRALSASPSGAKESSRASSSYRMNSSYKGNSSRTYTTPSRSNSSYSGSSRSSSSYSRSSGSSRSSSSVSRSSGSSSRAGGRR